MKFVDYQKTRTTYEFFVLLRTKFEVFCSVGDDRGLVVAEDEPESVDTPSRMLVAAACSSATTTNTGTTSTTSQPRKTYVAELRKKIAWMTNETRRKFSGSPTFRGVEAL